MLHGTTLAVTGASSGIGWEICRALHAEGCRVVACGRDAARLARLADSVPGITCLQADLSAPGGIDRLAERLLAMPGLDGIIHNAAVQRDTLLDAASYAATQLEHELRVNLLAPLELTRRLLPGLRLRPRAWLVFVTTGLVFAPKARATVYCATKSGLHAAAESLRMQLAGSLVRVVELVPPLVDTPMTAGRGRNKLPPAAVARALVRGLKAGKPRIYVGKAQLLPWLVRISPGLVRWLIARLDKPNPISPRV